MDLKHDHLIISYTLSTLITDAPNWANIIPQKGPGASPANSNTFIPFKGIFVISKTAL